MKSASQICPAPLKGSAPATAQVFRKQPMIYPSVIFIGAFLLFQVQPLLAKLVLPLFGGGAAIWTACLLFFQGFLLCGYFYSHCLTKLAKIRHQVTIHLTLLCISLIFLPLGLQDTMLVNKSGSPLINILIILTASVGLPYLLLAATGPLLQRWLSIDYPDKIPYKLYSLSNIGSLMALVSYPLLFEPALSMNMQAYYWTGAYGVFCLGICIICIELFKKNRRIEITESRATPREGAGDRKASKHMSQITLWLLLSSVGVVVLVSTTNAMTQNVQPIPFLWILPLCLYLLTFIISFHSPRWYVRWYCFLLFNISALAAILMFSIGSHFNIASQVGIYSFILFFACMICHGELALLKPGVERLTLFYLVISFGGFLGSAFVAFVAQNVFSTFIEFPLSILCVFLLFCASIYWHRSDAHYQGIPISAWMAPAGLVSASVLFTIFVYVDMLSEDDVATSRNFYGILSVKDVEVNGRLERRLIDGTTSHGTQSLQREYTQVPMSYYRANTGVALALEYAMSQQSLNVGIIGLGAGTLAAYGREGDKYTFYELNPDVETFAQRHFTYLDDSKAEVSVLLGDARVSLTREMDEQGSLQYDVLVVDAFSGDSIPAHLLTKEAFSLYSKHLTSSGLLAVHISNSHLDLTSLTRGLARSIDNKALYVKTEPSGFEATGAEWVIVTQNEEFIASATVKRLVTEWPYVGEETPIWTDDYSNLLSVLR